MSAFLIFWPMLASILVTMYGEYLWRMEMQAIYWCDDPIFILVEFGGMDYETILKYRGLNDKS